MKAGKTIVVTGFLVPCLLYTSSAMDAKMKSAVEHYLFTGKEFEGKTVLVITHDTREESLSQYDGIIHVGENGIYVE